MSLLSISISYTDYNYFVQSYIFTIQFNLTKLAHNTYNNNFITFLSWCVYEKRQHEEIGTILRWDPKLTTKLKDSKLLNKVNVRQFYWFESQTFSTGHFYQDMG